MGVLGGVIGAFFIHVNTRANALRKIYITKNWHKVVETALFCMVTVSLFYWMTYAYHSCVEVPDRIHEDEETYYRFWCKKDEYDTLATLFFSSEGEVIRNIMSSNVETTLS